MRATIVTMAGAVLTAAGAIALYWGYETEAPAIAALGFAAIIAGAVVLMFGASRMFGEKAAAPPRQPPMAKPQEEWQVRLLVQSMGAVAAADGAVSPDELATISRISERMMGRRIAQEEIAAMVAELKGAAVKARLAAERDRLPQPMRQTIVKCCYLVMMSDLDEDRKEIGKVREIGRALGFSAQETDDLIALAGV